MVERIKPFDYSGQRTCIEYFNESMSARKIREGIIFFRFKLDGDKNTTVFLDFNSIEYKNNVSSEVSPDRDINHRPFCGVE